MRRLLPYLSILLMLPAVGERVQRLPLPGFTSGYRILQTTAPPARALLFAYLDVAVLAAALGLAAYLALRKRSRRGVFALMVFGLLYFGFYRKGCVCAVGSIQNVALAAGAADYALPLTVAAFFVLPLAFALVFGRVFCAAVCPLGAAQDIVLLRPIKVPAWLEHALGLAPYLYLGTAVLLAATNSLFIICLLDPFVSFFRLSGAATMLLAGGAVLAVATMVGRPYCRFLCPYGVLLRWASAAARWRVRITHEQCVTCRLCEEGCPYGAITPPTPERHPGGRREGKARLATLAILLPLLVALGAYLGTRGGPALARQHHTVRVARQIMEEKRDPARKPTLETAAFRGSGQSDEALFREARALEERFRAGGLWLGAWVGLVIGAKLLFLSVRRRRTEYAVDTAACLACARCYQACPLERAKQCDRLTETQSELPTASRTE